MSPKTLLMIMGHSDISVTMNVYTHARYDHAAGQMLQFSRKPEKAENAVV